MSDYDVWFTAYPEEYQVVLRMAQSGWQPPADDPAPVDAGQEQAVPAATLWDR